MVNGKVFDCFGHQLKEGDEIIIAGIIDHEPDIHHGIVTRIVLDWIEYSMFRNDFDGCVTIPSKVKVYLYNENTYLKNIYKIIK